ncbi:MAG: sugar ABC transporter ATP-binding protein [Lentisphaeria bacterium]|nr:sugar ABC transporter ATP-binding protein [Lentisphaeria bacterium]
MNVLEISDLSKSFDGVPILRNIELSIPAGRIFGLAGENGAGKSTLARCISNKIPHDHGIIKVNGRIVDGHEHAGKVYVVPQEFNLIPNLTVAENIFLGRELTCGLFLDHAGMNARSRELLGRLECQVDPGVLVGQLSLAQRQLVELAKAFLSDAKLIIMDEPSTILNNSECQLLFKNMREIASEGRSIIFITHKLEEIRTICDQVVVLRDGELVFQADPKTISARTIAESMVGRELSQIYPPKIMPDSDAPWLLQVENLSDCSGRVKNCSFNLRRGEVIGVAGLAGAGRSELAETICGLRRHSGGKLIFNGEILKINHYSQALARGLVYLSEDRQLSGLLLDSDLVENSTLPAWQKYCRAGWVQKQLALMDTQKFIELFRIRCLDVFQTVRRLSGGNQQKVAIARGMNCDPELFIFDEPTRGVDVGARGEIYHFIHNIAAQGVACIIISSDIEEIMGNCRRVLVMRNGEIAGELTDENVSEKNIICLAAGVA